MILLDTSALLAVYDRSDRWHDAVRRILEPSQPRILSPFVLAELDYLVLAEAGQQVELEVLRDVSDGAYQLVAFDGLEVALAIGVSERYADLRLGLADASVMVLAERFRCHDILTLDERHFRAVTAWDGQPFRLLPADAQ